MPSTRVSKRRRENENIKSDRPGFHRIGTARRRRRDHTAVWTGTEMIIWGGQGTQAEGTGARYNPAPTPEFRSMGPMRQRRAPGTPRFGPVPKMIVWCGPNANIAIPGGWIQSSGLVLDTATEHTVT